MDRMPLWIELASALSAILILLMIALAFSTYRQNRADQIRHEQITADRLLSLKMKNLEQYLDELAAFSIQAVYDNSLYASIQSGEAFTDTDRADISAAVRTAYHTRSDLNSYMLYLLNQELAVGYMPGSRTGSERVRISGFSCAQIFDMLRLCTASPLRCAVLPSSDDGSLFCFIHGIVRVSDARTSAIVSFDVGMQSIEALTDYPLSRQEHIALYSPQGELLFCDLEAPPGENIPTPYATIGGVRYLTAVRTGERYGLRIVSLVPVSSVTEEIRHASIRALTQQLFWILLSILAICVFVRWLTAPLSILAAKQKQAGDGDFSAIDIGRSREIRELRTSFNEMTHRIDTLIRRNYAAELNEKTAQLAALEAQVNPHFLYNTLQAIGSEALLHDEIGLYRMLTSLASNLRHSIKADNIVTLGEEIRYVDNYVMLQKARMGDRLTVIKRVDPAVTTARVPKISIQPLVENSILHGLGTEKSSISIQIEAFRRGDYLVVQVTDDGIGIEETALTRLRESFADQTLLRPGAGIGLANLYHRIRLMYENDADILIRTECGENSFTTVTLILSAVAEPKLK
ncbi:sensor histidine kinase [Lachnoclostridium sp. Marseille-P6806]|uniref:sensor histidine kinase n=1 Tax=Lachnoclostridium sp. Marseille-P6806 TaxID=2364793 RepID=UPI0013EF0D72|nr:histidine kinase [Lachnoclostridium sp. Marseille-P6806]